MKVSKKVAVPEKMLPLKSKKVTKIKPIVSDKVAKEDAAVNIPTNTVFRAVEAVEKLVKDFQKRKNILFADDTSFLLQVEAVKVPRCPKRKLRLKLPHWLVTDTSDICLFVCDLKRGKRVDHEPTVHHYEDLLKAKGITNIKTVMPVRQLRVEYDQMEMRRRLITQYDFFLADSRVSGLLAHKLGLMFYKKNALPVPIKMESKDLKEEINKALHKTTIRLHSEGDTFLVKVGVGKQTTNQICENIQSVLLQLAKHFPGGWANVRSVHLKSAQSMSIPIYMTLKCKNSVPRPVIKPLHAQNDMVEGDLTTVMGARVQVFADGRVKVIKRKSENTDNESDFDDDDDVPTIKSKKSKSGNSNDVKSAKGAKKNGDTPNSKVKKTKGEEEDPSKDDSDDVEISDESEEDNDDEETEDSDDDEDINEEESDD